VLYTLWSAKGGSGTTVTAALLAASFSDRPDALLVDLSGDLPGVVGAPEPAEGLADLCLTASAAPDAIRRAEVEVADGVALLAKGGGPLDPAGFSTVWDVLAREQRDVVVDAGTLHLADATGERSDRAAAVEAVRRAERSLLVVRSCYLGLRAAIAMLSVLPAEGCILVMEAGRLLRGSDVAAVLGIPVLAELHLSAGVARATDAGLLLRRPDRPSVRALRSAA
jgi:hypothetical protein